MVEVAEGEVIFRREELSVTLLVDIEQLAAVEVYAAPGWGKTPLHLHARHGEALYVFEGEVALRLEDREHRLGPGTWAFVPPEVVHAFEVMGGDQARFLDLHAPGSGYGDYVRGSAAAFDQQPPPEHATGDPGLAVLLRAGVEGEEVTNRSPERRATLLVDAGELTIAEFAYGPGERGAKLHVHHDHADAFLVVEGEFTFHLRDGSRALPAETLVVFPPGVVHGFDNDSDATARCFNLHVPASGFADYLRGRNPDFDQHDPAEDGGLDPAAVVVTRLSE
jgi:quercetin dioxygenase-like cupin family protein